MDEVPTAPKKKIGKPIKKGQVLNPYGAQMHDPYKREVKQLTSEALIEVLNDVLLVEPSKIGEVVAKNPTVLKNYIAAVLQKAMAKGDMGPLVILLERMIGKVKDNIQVESKSISVNLTTDQVKSVMNRVDSEF